MIRRLWRLLELGAAALGLWIVGSLAVELLTWLVTLVRADPATGFSAGGPAYPNEWGVRLEPLTPAETRAALERERAAERTPSPRAAESLGSDPPAARASTTTVRPAGT